jgi:dipeptidyl aminopeptidase/acylaminoacyl peptidase
MTQGRHKAFGGEPWDGLEKIDLWNPARFAHGMNTPMLVVHGELDYRVPVDQGLECYNVLQGKGVPARLVYFPDENHWVLKARNATFWYREVHDWLARFLKRA